MTPHESHPGRAVLLDLALDDADDATRRRLLHHLDGCPTCRGEYAAVRAGVEAVLPAAPAVEPPPGFDARVLEAVRRSSPERARRTESRRGRGWLLVASVLAALAVGAGGATLLGRDDPTAAATAAADLRTDDGSAVGGVVRAGQDGRPVLVVWVDDGPEGMRYTCRLDLADGTSVDAAAWTLGDGPAAWVVELPRTGVTGVELVTDAGRVWSSAEL